MLLKIYFLNCELTTIVLVRCVVCCGTTLDKPCWPFDMSCQEDYFNLHFLLLFDTFSIYFLCQYPSGDLTCSFHALHECCYSLSFLRILSWTKSVRPLPHWWIGILVFKKAHIIPRIHYKWSTKNTFRKYLHRLLIVSWFGCTLM